MAKLFAATSNTGRPRAASLRGGNFKAPSVVEPLAVNEQSIQIKLSSNNFNPARAGTAKQQTPHIVANAGGPTPFVSESPVEPMPFPAAPQSAQTAAEQISPVEIFKNLNSSLPDGVRYEPLDKETLRQLREAAPPAPLSAEPPPAAAPSPDNDDLIEGLMQDERNAKIFYTHLAETATRPDIKNAMNGAAEDCAVRLKDYGEICKKLRRRAFTPKETEINTRIDFQDGVALALTEENKAIRALTEWLDSRPDADISRLLQNIINKKITNYNLLSFIYFNSVSSAR